MATGIVGLSRASRAPRVFRVVLSCAFTNSRAPTLGLWGGAAGITLFFLVDSIPIFRRGLYEKLPLVGSRYDDSVDPQDSPF